jgi:tetratricopeptide (TPR) repeat protein
MPAPASEPRPALIAMVALLLGAVLTGGWLLATQSARGEPAPAAPASPEDQLAAIVAAQPENIEARRRLGDLHFAADRFDAALEQYLKVLDAFPQQAQTLARAGWIAFEGGDSATAVRLVDSSLAIAERDPEALWYLAQIHLYGLDDPDAAVVPLRRLLERDDLSAQLRRDARGLLATARR